jgi:hypothetical protein
MIGLICLVFAFVCFAIAAAGLSTGKINLISLGLAFYILSLLLGKI